MRRSASILTLILLALCLNGCATHLPVRSGPEVLRIKGSDSMFLLVQRLAEEYQRKHPGVTVEAEGGGSGAGIAALIDGRTEICATSRPLSSEEVGALARRHRSLGVSILCAKDALSVIVHPGNPLSDLPLRKVVEIFDGSVTEWSAAGGIQGPITVYSREPNSGTSLFFEDHVLLGKEYSAAAVTVPGARSMISAIAADTSGIGYSTSAYLERVKALSIDGVPPNAENVRNGRYPIARYLYLYTVHQPSGEIKRFLDWVVSADGQAVAAANGYIPLYAPE